jgi:hypothetical protein
LLSSVEQFCIAHVVLQVQGSVLGRIAYAAAAAAVVSHTVQRRCVNVDVGVHGISC